MARGRLGQYGGEGMLTTKWQFPLGTQIAANSFLLIWADGEDTGLHTNFKLSKSGEEVGLFDINGALLDEIVYPEQSTDISYGRISDGNETWGFFVEPTPGTTNNTVSFDDVTHYRVKFSEKGGFYNNPITVVLSATDGDIRYTLDGSFPTDSDPIYTNPIFINSTTNLRASVFLPNQVPGKATTHTYFFNENFDSRKLPVVSISTNPEYFWDADIGIYVQDFKPDWEHPINIELFENDGSDRAAFNELAGIKINGQNSWILPQKMLGIYFDNEYDQNNIEYPLFFDRGRNKFDSFILRAGGSDWSFTMFRDGLSQKLAEETMGLERTGFRPSIVFVNGEYLGIHNIRSRADEGFIEDNFGLDGSEYDLVENNGEVEQGDSVAFDQLWTLLNQNLAVQSNYDAVAEVMDIENFMDFFITEIYLSNSSFGHNIEIWKPKQAGAKWRWILSDFDRGFSGSNNNGIDYFTTSNSPGGYAWIRAGLNNMLDNEAFANAFVSRFADHLYTTFHPDRVRQFISKHQSAIEVEMPMHIDRWAGTTSSYGDAIESFEFWQNEVLLLHKYIDERHGYVFNDLIERFNVTSTAVLGLVSAPIEGGIININNHKVPGGNWMGTYLEDIPITLTAEAQAGHQFEGWSVGGLQTFIPKESVWKYFDNGTNPGNSWMANSFSDASWNFGPAQLGYGDSDENTVVSFGSDPDNKHITTYYRKTFQVPDPSLFTGKLLLNILRDDGIIVYLNGEEIHKSNIPVGSVDYQTEAIDWVANPTENTFNLFSVNVDELLSGDNVIAVEVHQDAGNSSDHSFDLELKALLSQNGPIISSDLNFNATLTDDLIMVAHFLPTGACVLPDTIAQNTTLTIDCSPYLAREDVVVLPNVVLEVDPGVAIHFPEEATLMVNGGLLVNGTEDQPVVFRNDENANAETWGNITFHNATTVSQLNWLELINASRGDHPVQENAAIAAWHSTVNLNHATIEDVAGNPVLGRYSDIWMLNSKLHSKVTGDLINVKYGFGFIENCEFRGNDQVDTDAIDYDEVIDGAIRNNKIYDFYGFNSDGIDLGEASENVLLENNFIHNITDKGVSVGQTSSVIAKNNTIVNCSQGYGVKDESVAIIDRNTFYNNGHSIAAFEKNIGSGGGIIEVTNSIFSNAALETFLIDENSSGTVDYCLSDTDTLIGNNFMFTNPLFENPTANDFTLKTNSPAIDAGVLNSGSVVNLGTNSHLYEAEADVQISGIHYHPADSLEAEFLQLYNPSDESILLGGYSFTEGIQFTFPAGTVIDPDETIYLTNDEALFPPAPEQIFEWDLGALSNGGEQLILRDANTIIVDHVTYNDVLPWPEGADGLGGWLTLISPDLDNHFAESWMLTGLVGVEEDLEKSSDFTIYPNPARERIYVKSKGGVIEKVEIYNAVGMKMFFGLYDAEDEITIDLQKWPVGIYCLKINENDGELMLIQ